MVLTLVFSMLAPAVCSLLDVEMTSIVMKDFAEEESQKKGEIEKLEKDVVLHYLEYALPFEHYQESMLFGVFSENDSRFVSEIILPPPEPTV